MQVTYFLNSPMVNLLLLMKLSEYWKIVDFPQVSVKIKNFKTFYKAQTASHFKKIIQLPSHQVKSWSNEQHQPEICLLEKL